MDMTDPELGFPKPEPRVLTKRTKRLTDAEQERICRAEVKRLYGVKCAIPGCRELGEHQHHIIFRSRSRALKYEPQNRRPICAGHHQLIHDGLITLTRTAEDELIVHGDAKLLRFKL